MNVTEIDPCSTSAPLIVTVCEPEDADAATVNVPVMIPFESIAHLVELKSGGDAEMSPPQSATVVV